MKKISVNLMTDDKISKIYPSALFLYGTYKDDKSPNFGMFCWFNYCWDTELAIMACIGGSKLTKDRINAEKVFSANLVTEPLLPLADYLGKKSGYEQDKMDISIEIEQGNVLNVPILKNSPWIYELEVNQSIPLNGSDLYICKIRNLLIAEALQNKSKNDEEIIKQTSPVLWFGTGKYFSTNAVKIEK